MSEKIACPPLPTSDLRHLTSGIRPLASDPKPLRTALVLAFAAIYLIWGSTYLGIRIAIESMPPFLMAAVARDGPPRISGRPTW
jgi:hypothetical protein